MGIDVEFDTVKLTLDSLGVEYENAADLLQFSFNNNRYAVLKSRERDGKLLVSCTSSVYVDTAIEVLRTCGVIE